MKYTIYDLTNMNKTRVMLKLIVPAEVEVEDKEIEIQ
jgi:hypothetical protein